MVKKTIEKNTVEKEKRPVGRPRKTKIGREETPVPVVPVVPVEEIPEEEIPVEETSEEETPAVSERELHRKSYYKMRDLVRGMRDDSDIAFRKANHRKLLRKSFKDKPRFMLENAVDMYMKIEDHIDDEINKGMDAEFEKFLINTFGEEHQATPLENTPVEEIPVENTPVEEIPVEETPVEETDGESVEHKETIARKKDNCPFCSFGHKFRIVEKKGPFGSKYWIVNKI